MVLALTLFIKKIASQKYVFTKLYLYKAGFEQFLHEHITIWVLEINRLVVQVNAIFCAASYIGVPIASMC